MHQKNEKYSDMKSDLEALMASMRIKKDKEIRSLTESMEL